MKISVDGKELFELTAIQEKVIMYQVPSDIFESDMKRRLQWVLMHKYEECFKALKEEWDSKLAASGIKMIPTDRDAYAQVVFGLPAYEDRKARDARIKQ